MYSVTINIQPLSPSPSQSSPSPSPPSQSLSPSSSNSSYQPSQYTQLEHHYRMKSLTKGIYRSILHRVIIREHHLQSSLLTHRVNDTPIQ